MTSPWSVSAQHWEFDLVTTSELGIRIVLTIDELRPGRYQFVLGMKFKADVVVYIDGASTETY